MMRLILPVCGNVKMPLSFFFFKGNADLNSLHILNMVGTRNATDYGTQICASFLRDLKALFVLKCL